MLWTISVCNSIYKLKKSCLKDIKLGTRVCPKEEMTPIDLVITGQGQGSNYNGHQPPNLLITQQSSEKFQYRICYKWQKKVTLNIY